MRARLFAVMALPALALPALVAPPGWTQAPTPPRVGVGAPAVTVVEGPSPTETTSAPPAQPVATSSTAVPATVAPPATPAPTAPSSTAVGVAITSTTTPASTVIPPSTSTTLAGPTTTTLVPPPRTPAEIRSAISQALRGSGAQNVGALAVIDGIGPVYELNSTNLLPPASILKLLTAGAALAELGVDHRFETTIRALGDVGKDGVVHGDLAIVVSGDPSLATGDLNRLADTVAAAGIRTIEGAVVVDDLRVDRSTQVEGWKPSFVPGEVGYLTGFVVDGNHRYDTPSRTDASLANLVRFADRLKAKGVTIIGGQRRALRPTDGGTVLAMYRSPSMNELVTRMMKNSENTYAELILRALGTRTGHPTTAGGAAIVATVADRYGIPRPMQYDGSGLSANNRVTAAGMVKWLRELDATPIGGPLRASLPVACVDGTMRGRLCQTPAAGRAQAKTGSLDYTVTLAGFTTTATGRRVTYTFLLTGLAFTARGRAAVDRAVSALSAYAG